MGLWKKSGRGKFQKILKREEGEQMLYTFYRRQQVPPNSRDIEVFERCFYVETSRELLEDEAGQITWLLSETFEPNNFDNGPFLKCKKHVVELGPRFNVVTARSSNAVSACRAIGLPVERIEESRRFLLKKECDPEKFKKDHHDRMTEMEYPEPLKTFETDLRPSPVRIIRVIEDGKEALRKINTEMGLGLDEWDIEYYYDLFVNKIGRNPTDVECFDLGQSNSEHSRHWFFKGKIVIDGKVMPKTLMELVQEPLKKNPGNSVIGFNDNSSAIRGYSVTTIIPKLPGTSSPFVTKTQTYHIIFTAETHNFPTGVAPFPGAETGTGGRIRDVQATGRGGLVIAGTAAYCVGNLQVPGYKLPWEDDSFVYPGNLASPLQIEIEASNGASDYGNKFGEPVIQGFTRSFGLRLSDGSRVEWIKPIMFTGGIGQMDDRHVEKGQPERGMYVVKIGGPGFRIGVGGGAASSMIQGENKEGLDFSAVQRGDAEMEQKVNRAIRACIEMGILNPIVTIHDQGAGGNCNVVKEIIYPAGAKIEIRSIQLGDNTLSVLEIWGAEYQEQNALLLNADAWELFVSVCAREKVPVAKIGEITGDGYIILHDESDGTTPVNLDLALVLGEMPQKTFSDTRVPAILKPLEFPKDLTVREALERVLKLVSVGSKKFLTNKVDRSVTGLIAQQQCVGPLQLTLSDVAVIAQSHFGLTGAAISIGEKPISGLINPKAMARMAVAEALTNIMWAKVSRLEDIKFSANWMWAAKLPGEAVRMYEAAEALNKILKDLAIDGGKDSLSMAAKVPLPDGSTELVKSPGQLVMSAYCTVPDITKVITPDIKRPGSSRLLFIDLACGKRRLGGSALAQVYGQVGDECPDVEDPELIKNAFYAIQELIEKDLILAGHDISDGGLIVALLEMAFAGNCGVVFTTPYSDGKKELLPNLFAEECGVVIEIPVDSSANDILIKHELYQCTKEIGWTVKNPRIQIIIPTPQCTDEYVLDEDMRMLRGIWEETSHQLELLQCNPQCAEEEKKNILDRSGMKFRINFEYGPTAPEIMELVEKPKVAVVREEGSNGDREMTSAFYQAGFETWDVTMTDLLEGRITLDKFRGVAYVGGFSYADVLDSAKGWAGVIRFNEKLKKQFDEFYNRPDTFSLGVCNGCQLMALLGWVPWRGIPDEIRPRFIKNKSGRFESRFSAVHIQKSPAIMLKGMEGSTLGVWVAHGEGRMHFPDERILDDIFSQSLAPIRFVDDNNTIAENGKYPFNPNDSPYGITGLCSLDGRHLAMMPHPERAFLKWQWAYKPDDWKNTPNQVAPWLKMFQNARIWCEQTK